MSENKGGKTQPKMFNSNDEDDDDDDNNKKYVYISD